jgi:acyl-homoserine-lactone acylase
MKESGMKSDELRDSAFSVGRRLSSVSCLLPVDDRFPHFSDDGGERDVNSKLITADARRRTRCSIAALVALVVLAACSSSTVPTPATLMQQVEVRRTAYGVPHIKAQTFAAAGYAEAYVQSEDYGARVALGLLRARGEMGKYFGRDSMASDFEEQRGYRIAVANYRNVSKDTRDVYEGFAAGVNRYIELHPEEFPAGFAPNFTGYDVMARDVEQPSLAAANRLASQPHPDDGSNAWAFAPSRTTSGKAILLRNPHLVWTAGYYEAHVVVPGRLDFYGDLRIGGPFGVIGGFNRDLGWATTNNDPVLYQIYSLDADTTQADHYWLDGVSHPLLRDSVTVHVKDAAPETRVVMRTSLGRVIRRTPKKIYVFKHAIDGEYHAGEQFLRMMRAKSLDEWKAAMRMGARLNSSFTYADRAGNIFYLWNAMLPALPHPSGGDSVATAVKRTSDAWSRYVPLDSLPQVLNPRGGYVHNQNDSPHYTNMRQPLDPARFPPYFAPPRLGLRSQHAIELIDNDRVLSLEDVVKLKHSYRMLLADRVRDDLVRAVRATKPTGEVARAIDLIAAWDKTVAPESRGGTLFEIWWTRYRTTGGRFARPWSPAEPTTTPRGLEETQRAVDAFTFAVDDIRRRFGAVDVAWGDVHRVRRGNVDVPVGGCASDLGCFRVITYRSAPDGNYEAVGSDGWILAVEFGDTPRGYSVLAYGESPKPDSPHFADQAAMFARGELKPIAWLDTDIDAQTIRRYRPGEKR